MSKFGIITFTSLLFLMLSSSLTGQKNEDVKKGDTNVKAQKVITVTKQNLPTIVDSIKKSPDSTVANWVQKSDSLRKVINLQREELSRLQKKKNEKEIVYVNKYVVKHDTVYIKKESWLKNIFKSKKKKDGNSKKD